MSAALTRVLCDFFGNNFDYSKYRNLVSPVWKILRNFYIEQKEIRILCLILSGKIRLSLEEKNKIGDLSDSLCFSVFLFNYFEYRKPRVLCVWYIKRLHRSQKSGIGITRHSQHGYSTKWKYIQRVAGHTRYWILLITGVHRGSMATGKYFFFLLLLHSFTSMNDIR